MKIPNAYLFVDGSASKGDDIGAWAAIAVSGDSKKLLYGIDFPTTISRCELRPIIEGVRWIRRNWVVGVGYKIRLYSDSEYTVKTLSGLYPRSKNVDLWSGFDAVIKETPEIYMEFVWRERNSLPHMTVCDEVCGAMRHHMIDFMKGLTTDYKSPEKSLPNLDLSEVTSDS